MPGAVVKTETGLERAIYLENGLFAVRHEPAHPNGRAVVICPPLFADLLANYHREVPLSRRLASAGYTVVRFHYRGTGSSGIRTEAFTLDSAVEDGLLALGALHGIEDVTVVGTRLSTVIAAEVRNISQAGQLILWDPFVNSRAIFREGFRAGRMRQLADQDDGGSREDFQATLEAGGTVDLLGCQVRAETYRSFWDLELCERLGQPGRLLLVPFGEVPGSGAQRVADCARARTFDVTVSLASTR